MIHKRSREMCEMPGGCGEARPHLATNKGGSGGNKRGMRDVGAVITLYTIASLLRF